MMRDHIAASLAIEEEDLEYIPFSARGGAYRARRLFGVELDELMRELTEALAA
ncbi:hypothetical protein Mtai_v1c18180 [Meiothermus taiwanensis WR-220]|jgi:type I restriction enzyme R subunit|uniref:EcoEI R protein C-terminal domain-containing protein n=1 Tax=Meiothermus taiwanensis WR-220 TaxID=1339250 RepID=A0ABN5M223_9DEIN|nr:hypothetical protein Mtai_v1c18180 [Meiothermus taiwanensis WR-220]